MSGGGKRGNGGGVAVGSTPQVSSSSAIPQQARKIVQNLREIVDHSEAEIYAMLKECNMDPSETVHRLLSQDTFHEVKSKREKKKETRETPDPSLRGMNSNSNRGARSGTDRGTRTSSAQSSSYDYGAAQSKPVRKKENGTNVVPTQATGSGASANNLNRRSTTLSEVVSVQNTTPVPVIADMPALCPQSSPGIQQNWGRAPGQMSMADIVRKGKPQSKPFVNPTPDSFMPNVPHPSVKQPPFTTTPASELAPESSKVLVSHEERYHELNAGDDWSTHPELSTARSLLADQDSHLDDNQVEEGDADGDAFQTESTRSASVSDVQIDEENSEDSTHLDDGSLNAVDSYHSHRHAIELHGVGDVDEEISATAENLEQLDLHKGDLDAPPSEDNPAVIIPSHLQVTNADCSHLSFGSFGSAVSASLSGSYPSNSLRNNLEMPPVTEDSPSLDQLNSRNSEYYDDDRLQSTLSDNVTSITNTSTRSYDMPSASQPEIVRDENLEAAHGLQTFHSPSGYGFSTTPQPSAASYAYPDPSPQVQNLSPFSSLMQPYSNSLPSNLLATSVSREFDMPLSALLANQSMKYNTQAPSISGPISTPEVKQEVFSAPQPISQALASSSIPTPAGGPTLPQHLPTYPYSQPTLPLGHFANMVGYPFLPQSYTFLPSAAFQQAYAANSPFHQSPTAGMKYSPLPQYKSSISAASNLSQSPALPPGYGNFTSSTNNIPGYGGFTGSAGNLPGGGFSLNQTNTSASTGMGFEEALSMQYKEGSQYIPQQLNENSAMWIHGAGSRAAVSALPGNTFYGIQAHQNQQNGGGFRQAQQQHSQYGPGPMGYLNFYQSQGGSSQEQIQQNPSDGNVSGSQGPVSHQMWQQHGHGY